jgi:hypothetical protein
MQGYRSPSFLLPGAADSVEQSAAAAAEGSRGAHTRCPAEICVDLWHDRKKIVQG